MKRKGQTGEAFKYIFGIIIGSMFLIFFIGFAYKYMTVSGSKSDAELTNAISDELTALSVSLNAQDTLDYSRDLELYISKGVITPESLSIGKQMNKVIFSPLKIEGREIYIATKTFELPYKTVNFFYFDDKRTYYVLVYNQKNPTNEEFAEELTEGYASMPSNFDYQLIDESDLSSNLDSLATLTKNYEKVRFIFLTESNINPESYFENYDIIEVTYTDEEEFNYGEIEFVDGSSIYLTKEMLVGAFISENKDEYDYNMELALSKLNSITNLYYEKSKFISTRLPNCDYTSVKTSLNNYKGYIGNTDTAMTYQSYVNTIEAANKNLGGECPEIF
ncbi:hypothetical protein HOD38_01290 [archaeon]|jgi:hypothetical protein|nr:hypothetical protein [archaeon]MBT4396879.1 hypothetical protein [archaeon]MBT4441443.1 hypothetical protein [archaeon]